MKIIDLSGQRFGRLIVVGFAGSVDGHKKWECRCDCGAVKRVGSSNLRRGNVKSCGCLVRTHRMSRGRTYKSWQMMHQRCGNPANGNYTRYGAKGISVCARWDSFESFVADMGERPEGTSLDRRDSRGNYEPNNCRWSTREEQNINTSQWAGFRDIDGKRISVREMAHALAMPSRTVHRKMRLTR